MSHATTGVLIDSHEAFSRLSACGRHFSVSEREYVFILCGLSGNAYYSNLIDGLRQFEFGYRGARDQS